MKKPGFLTRPRIIFLTVALCSWWVTGRYASTGRAVVRTLVGEAEARLDKKGAAAAAVRMQALTAAGTSVVKIAAVLASWGTITDVLELRRLYESCEKLAEPWRSLARLEAIRRWVELDPKTAASYAVAHRDPEFLREFINRWGTGLSADALAASMKEIFGDPRNFAALMPGENNRREYTRVSVEKTKILLGKLDPIIALQAWAKLGFAKMPGEAVFALFQSSAAKDPDGAAALAAGIPDEKMRKVAEDALLAGLALADPAKALAQMPQGSPLRQTIYNHAFSTLAATDPQLAISYIEKLPPGDQGWARINFCSAWLKHDPAAAAKYAQEHSPPQWRSYFARNLVDAVEAGQAKAPDWQIVSQLQDPVMRSQLGGVALNRVLEQGPEAFQQQWEILTTQQQAESLAGMAGTTPGNNAIQAHWTELAPKVTALQGAALEQALSSGALGSAWAQQDPVSLLKALDQHPHSAAAEKATAAAVREWAAQDLAGARTYVEQIPPGPRQDAARGSLESR